MELYLEIQNKKAELDHYIDLEYKCKLIPARRGVKRSPYFDRITTLREELKVLTEQYNEQLKREQFKQTLFSYINKTR